MAGQTPKCSTISVYPTMGWITSRSAARHSKRPSRSMIRTYSRRKRGRFSRNCHESGRNSHPIPLGCYSRSGPIKPLVSRRESLHNPACDTTSSLTGTYGIRCGRHGAFVGKYYTRQRNRNREKIAFDTTSLATATQVNVWRNIFETPGFLNVGARSGSFLLVVPGADATFNAPWVLGSGLSPLWSVDPFTFNLDSSTVIAQTAVDLVVTGIGRISGTGFADTLGSRDFTAQSAGGANENFFTVSANDVVTGAAPDGGSTATLLGIGLGVIAFIRRKLRLCA